MKIKICGITNLEDALDACNAGADALGFVFYKPSPRYITPQNAKKIIADLPPFVQVVGLFVNETAQTINQISKEANIDLAQIITDDETIYDDLEIRFVKVVRATSKEDVIKNQDRFRLIDAFVEGFGGMGTRLSLEWFDGVDCSKIIIAGGLDSENVKELKGYNFYSVDISSGVEISKGKKDKEKMINFIKAVNELHK
jgi:phosphoribosylanthranilate isomerase